MNKIIFLENLSDNVFRLIESNGYDFLENIEKFCYESFDQENTDVRTFAFILNDNHNNYFAELLSNDKFIKNFNKLVSEKITVFWCEPKILDQESSINNFEHFVKVKGLDPTKLWSKLVGKLKDEPYFKGKETDSIFPAMFLLSVKKQSREGVDTYPIMDMYCISLHAYEFFDNVNIFKEEFIKLFEDIVNEVSKSTNQNKSINKPIFTMDEIKREVIRELTKIMFKETYSDLLSFIKDIFENIG